MLPTFPYVAMTITGVLHVLFGLCIFINACVGYSMDLNFLGHQYVYLQNEYQRHMYTQTVQRVIRIYLGIVIGSSLWIILVGTLGILTGVKHFKHQRTHGLKIAYMVTAILSACIFSLSGLSLSVMVKSNFNSIGLVGSVASFADFVLAIVSASICCCCANSTATTTGVVFVQQGQAPPGVYPPGTYPPPGVYPPGTYPPPSYPASVQTYNIGQSPQEGVVNPGYNLNPSPVDYPTKNEVV